MDSLVKPEFWAQEWGRYLERPFSCASTDPDCWFRRLAVPRVDVQLGRLLV
jgi:hypothetical protein